MSKQRWLARGVVLAGVAGIAAALAGPGATGGEPASVEAATIATAALLTLFAVVFIGQALADGAEIARIRRRIDVLVLETRGGEPVGPDTFMDAIGDGTLGDRAQRYALTLQPGSPPDERYAGADPKAYFAVDGLIGDRLYLTAFRHLPTVLILLSVTLLAFGLRGLLADYGQGAGAATLAANGEAILFACAIPLCGALMVGTLVPAVTAVRRRQLARLIERVGLLFQGGDGASQMRRLVEAQSAGNAELRRNLGTALDEIRKLFESLRRRIDGQAIGRGAIGIEPATALISPDDLPAGSGWSLELERKLDQAIERFTQIADSLGAAPAIDSAAAIKQLNVTVDSLCLSVAPVLNRLADTQDDLLAALSGENTTSRLLADAAEDLRQLSRANRDTLERHMQLATELAKVGQMLESMAASAQARPAVTLKASDGLMRAFHELKSETDAAASRLPSLDPVA